MVEIFGCTKQVLVLNGLIIWFKKIYKTDTSHAVRWTFNLRQFYCLTVIQFHGYTVLKQNIHS